LSDDIRDSQPKRAFGEDDSLETSGLAAFRARVQRIALPSVLALAVSAGLVFGGISANNHAAETLTAAPSAPVALAERQADQPSRAGERTPTAAPTPAEVPAEAPPAAALTVADPQKLTGVSFAPSPSPSASKTSESVKMYATTSVNIRTEANPDSNKVGSLSTGDSTTATGRTDNGFSQVEFNDRTGWVSSQYLSRTAPAKSAAPSTPAASESSAPAQSNASSSRSTSAAAPGGGTACAPLPGLTPRTEAVHQALCAGFPAVDSYGGVRPDWDAEHPSGRAIDAMVSSTSTGNAVADWARANAAQYGITEVIWNQRIWTTQRASEGWRAMGDRGSVTANHGDHVHISVR
jgi:hypothetical protein